MGYLKDSRRSGRVPKLGCRSCCRARPLQPPSCRTCQLGYLRCPEGIAEVAEPPLSGALQAMCCPGQSPDIRDRRPVEAAEVEAVAVAARARRLRGQDSRRESREQPYRRNLERTTL